MKKVLVIVIVLSMVLSLVACAPAAKEAESEVVATEEVEVITLGFSNYDSDENANLQKKGFADFCDDWNAAGNSPQLVSHIVDAGGSLDKQLGDVDTLISMGAQGLYVDAIDVSGLVPSVEKAVNMGIPVFEDRGIPSDLVVHYNAADETIMGEMAYDWYDTYLTENPDAVLNIGLQYGLASMPLQFIRVDRCVELLQENYPDRVTIIDEQFCDWDTALGMACMENWFQKYGNDMNCIIAAGAMMGVGASQALVGAGQDMDDWVITSTDATADVLYAINAGDVDMSVGMDAYEIGRIAAEMTMKLVTGEFTGTVYDAGTDVLVQVSEANIDEWYKGE